MSKWEESWGIVLRGTLIFRSRWCKGEDWQRGWRKNRSWSFKIQGRREFQRQEKKLVREKAVALETGFFLNVFKCFCERKWETQVWSLGWEDLLEEEMAIHSSILAWEILWTEEPSGLQSMWSQRVGYDWSDWAHCVIGLPAVSAGKESACNVGGLGSIPGLGRSPGERNGYPLQYSGLENSMRSQRVGHDWVTFTHSYCVIIGCNVSPFTLGFPRWHQW